MAFAVNGAVRLHYEAFGRPDDAAVLLLAGAGRQGVDFSEAFCHRIAAQGYRVIRFDQRDTGLSSVSPQPPHLVEVFDAVQAGARRPWPTGSATSRPTPSPCWTPRAWRAPT